jgi:hypothetical protein
MTDAGAPETPRLRVVSWTECVLPATAVAAVLMALTCRSGPILILNHLTLSSSSYSP